MVAFFGDSAQGMALTPGDRRIDMDAVIYREGETIFFAIDFINALATMKFRS
jgi:hypothetical protein